MPLAEGKERRFEKKRAMSMYRFTAGWIPIACLVAGLASWPALTAEDQCAGILDSFNDRLAQQQIPQNDPRALDAWEKARPHCEGGRSAEALEVLNRMLADAGAPPISASSAEENGAESGG